jgi:hypothetical protein
LRLSNEKAVEPSDGKDGAVSMLAGIYARCRLTQAVKPNSWRSIGQSSNTTTN